MVERTKAQTFDEFIGTVESVELEQPKEDSKNKNPQYHIVMEPHDVKVEGKTGKMHEWIRLPPKSTESTVPEGSVADNYLKALERLDKGVKEIKTVEEAFKWLEGKTFKFVKEKLGKAFGDYEAADYWIPANVAEKPAA